MAVLSLSRGRSRPRFPVLAFFTRINISPMMISSLILLRDTVKNYRASSTSLILRIVGFILLANGASTAGSFF